MHPLSNLVAADIDKGEGQCQDENSQQIEDKPSWTSHRQRFYPLLNQLVVRLEKVDYQKEILGNADQGHRIHDGHATSRIQTNIQIRVFLETVMDIDLIDWNSVLGPLHCNSQIEKDQAENQHQGQPK